MKSPDLERPDLEPGDERLLERVREAYAPEPLTPAQRSAFDAALRARLERRTARVWLPAALAAGAAAALLALLLARPAPEQGAGAAAASAAGDAFTAELLLADGGAYGESEQAESDALPPQYAAIASLLGP